MRNYFAKILVNNILKCLNDCFLSDVELAIKAKAPYTSVITEGADSAKNAGAKDKKSENKKEPERPNPKDFKIPETGTQCNRGNYFLWNVKPMQ